MNWILLALNLTTGQPVFETPPQFHTYEACLAAEKFTKRSGQDKIAVESGNKGGMNYTKYKIIPSIDAECVKDGREAEY